MFTFNSPFSKMGKIGAACLMAVTVLISAPASADSDFKVEAEGFVHRAPLVPSEPWTLAAGGRIYDNWWTALGRDEPVDTNPAYPAAGEQEGSVTWRCKECHGWDYAGVNGVYASGSRFTGISGIRDSFGAPIESIMVTLRNANHPYTSEMITDAELARVATFVSRGQIDMSSFIDAPTRTLTAGNVDRGRGIFQTVCAACHGFDGRMINWGDPGEFNFVGTEASELPDEVMHKIRNQHPGVQMVNMSAFPIQYSIDVLAYAATLPVSE